MVNICGKCKHFTRSETDKDGNFHYYCSKVYELFPPETSEDYAEGETQNQTPDLKLTFNSEICQYFEKNRRRS